MQPSFNFSTIFFLLKSTFLPVAIFLFTGCATVSTSGHSAQNHSAQNVEPEIKVVRLSDIQPEKIEATIGDEAKPSEDGNLTTASETSALPEHYESDAEVVWETDFQQAKRRAATEHKNIFMLVTAVAWCLPCQLLHDHVFEESDLLKVLAQTYVLFVVDFSQMPERQAEQDAAQALVEKYDLQILPEMLLLESDGKVFGRFEFEGTDAAVYLQSVNEFEQNRHNE